LDLYDLLILIFSDQGKICDMEGLKQKAGLSPDEWEDLTQYTIQVKFYLISLDQI